MRPWLALPVLLVALPAASDPVPPWERAFLEADPAEVRAAVEALPPPADVEFEILLEEGSIRFDENGRSDYLYRVAYRVLTDAAARSMASVGASWDPSREDRPVLRARVITADGLAHLLDPTTLGETGAGPGDGEIYRDRRAFRGPLPAIAAGAVVEEETVYRNRNPLLAEGDAGRFWFRGAPTRRIRLRLDAPASLPLRFAAHGIDLEPREHREGDRRIVVFEAGPLAPTPPVPDDVPPGHEVVPHVQFSTGASWAAVARAYHGLVEQQLQGADVGELIRGLDRRAGVDALLASLFERIQARVRYTGLEFGEAAIVPRRPAETLGRRYGDCKDLSALVVAALRSLGIEAHLALVSTQLEPDPALPGLGVFDHAIVAIAGKQPKYVDPTDFLSRGAHLPASLQGRLALVASPSTGALTPLPVRRARDHVQRVRTTVHLAERGPARATCDSEFPGAVAAWMRGNLPTATPEERTRWTNALAAAALRVESGAELRFEAGRPGEPFRLHLEAAASNLGNADEHEAVAALGWSELFAELPDAIGSDAKEERKHALALPPFRTEVEVAVSPPPGFALRQLPASGTIPLGPLAVVRTFEAKPDGTVIARAVLDTGDRHVLTAAEAEAVRKAVAAFEGQTLLHFDRTAAVLLAAGRTREALAEERRLAALHPREALHHSALAQMLLDIGLGRAARAEARRAIELEPENAAAHRTLAWVLQHDPFGRRFRPGWDREGALAAYRRAKELDPGDHLARADLAILLEYAPDGVRYERGADLDAAVAEYRGVWDWVKETNLAPNLLHALFRAGRFEEVVRDAPDFAADASRDQLWVAAVAATEGIEAAVRKAQELAAAGEARRVVLAAASQHLLYVRRYDLAAALVARAAVGAENAHALQMQASLLSRLKRTEDAPIDAADPSRIYDRLLLGLTGGQAANAAVRGLVSKGLAADDPSFDAEKLAAALAFDRSGDELPVAVLLDFGTSLVERSVQGDEKTGYRIQLRAPSPTGQNEFRLYAVKEDGAVRFRAAEDSPAPLGSEALARADRGDLAGARQWLAWATEGNRVAAGECDGLAAARRVVARGEAATAEEVRRAAAVLAAQGMVAAFVDRALELRKAVVDPEEALALDQGLVLAAARHRRPAASELLERLAPSFPESKRLFFARTWGYDVDGKRREGIDKLRPRARESGDPELVLAVIGLASRAGEFAVAEELGAALVAAGRDTPDLLNDLAWNALFREDLDEDGLSLAIERARQASLRGANRNASHLHTLATALAEAGRVREAIDALRTALDAKNGPPAPHDDYVAARVAEHLGLREEAIAAYRAIAGEGPVSPNATAVLARRRLAVLEGSR